MQSLPGPSVEYELSIIIPVLDEQEQINLCLDRLGAQGFQSTCQIIVVDGDPEGGTIQAVRDKRVICLTSERGRGRQMNAGAVVAEGNILLFLHVDTRLPPNTLTGVAAVMETNGYVGGAFRLGIDSESWFLRCIAAGANLRSRLDRIPYGDQAIFLSRAYFQAVGGFREIPVMEDIDLMRRIKRNGGKIRILRDKVMTSSRRWEAEGPLYTTLRNQVIRCLYHLGVSPEKLARFYRIQSHIRRRRGPRFVAERVEAMKETNGNCVILFLKEPICGRVKTRLAATVGADCTVELYKCFVEDTLSMLEGLNVSTRCYCDGSGSAEARENWLGRRHSYIFQSGADLGQRMANAFRDAFAAGFSKVVLIGSDLPDLPCDIMRQAFAALDAHDAVIGPSSDGGYYLIGFTAPHSLLGVFEDVPWSTARVFGQTMEILNSRGVRTCVLPQWHDVDTWSDLEDLIRRNANTSFRGSRTWAFVRKCGWVSEEEERSKGNV